MGFKDKWFYPHWCRVCDADIKIPYYGISGAERYIMFHKTSVQCPKCNTTFGCPYPGLSLDDVEYAYKLHMRSSLLTNKQLLDRKLSKQKPDNDEDILDSAV